MLCTSLSGVWLKYCGDVMKKDCNKEGLVMTKEGNEDFENSTKCWIMIILMMMLK